MSARTILNPPLTNELNGLFDGTTAIDVSDITITGDNIPNPVSLQCLSSGVLTIGGSCIANSFSAPYYGGGMLVGTYMNSGASIPANSSTVITISVPWNPISGWVESSTYPILTLTSTYGSIGLSTLGITKTSATTADIVFVAYNPNLTNPQQLFTVNYLLFYQ
jgi:hypothetical protein